MFQSLPLVKLQFQVKLGRMFNIRGVATQGRHDSNQWVTSFSLAYTADDFNWVYIRENSQVKVLTGFKERLPSP